MYKTSVYPVAMNGTLQGNFRLVRASFWPFSQTPCRVFGESVGRRPGRVVYSVQREEWLFSNVGHSLIARPIRTRRESTR